VKAHAKINLSLKVLHKRPDGYHELRTVFQTIGLADTLDLDFTPARQTSFTLEGMPDIPPEQNLIVRAARVVLDACRVSGRFACRIQKKIPLGGGLGGGSSNAAAVLLALPVLAGRRLELGRLMDLGAGLGSDVAFFLAGGTALGLGRGEELYPLPDMPAWPLAVVAPDLHVSTPDAYRALRRELTPVSDSATLNVFRSFVWSDRSMSGWENDFEPVVFARHPVLGRIRRKLELLGAPVARMSGSGAALFGVFPDRVDLVRACQRFRSEQLRVFPTQLISRARYRAAWHRWLQEFADKQDSALPWPPRSRFSR
jgi:4-diphosphocytidyl-2-C-methyl-D-erythritol kinase